MRRHISMFRSSLRIFMYRRDLCLPRVDKTTIAKAIFYTIRHRFDGNSFLENVREKSKRNDVVIQLQETLCNEILGY